MGFRSLLILLFLFGCSYAFSETALAIKDIDFVGGSDQVLIQSQSDPLAAMVQQCNEIADSEHNLKCSLSVIGEMFRQKAANLIPDYYQSVLKQHSVRIKEVPELKALFAMFGPESLSVLRAAQDFSVEQTGGEKRFFIKPYANDFFISEFILPYVDASLENGGSIRLSLDTGATVTVLNYETAKKFRVVIMPDSGYFYKSIYAGGVPVKLGMLPYIKVGRVEFRNILVFVSGGQDVLGLDLISKLGKIKISKDAVEYDASSPSECNSNVVYHQDKNNINQSLNFVALLDGHPVMAIIDTGNNEGVSSAWPGHGNREVLSSGSDSMQRSGITNLLYKSFQGTLTLPGNSMDITYKYYPAYDISPYELFEKQVPSLLLGWQMFDYFELHLDIDLGRSCFNRI